MAARVIVSSEGSTTPADNSKPRYWEAKNHSENSYLRVENWLNDVNDLLLPGRHEIVKMTLEQGQAILRYREELKMYAALADEKSDKQQKKNNKINQQNTTQNNNNEKPLIPADAMNSPEFLDNQWKLAEKDWFIKVHNL